MAWVATAIVGAGVLGAGASIYGANKAADAQTSAADKASQIAQDQYQQNRTDFAPFRQLGTDAASKLWGNIDQYTAPITMDQAALEQTPGYQFNLTQGLKAAQNSAAARGLGTSGAALKGATTFATGLADSTYQNQFNNAVTNQTNAYNRLKGLIDTGAGATNNTAASGTTAAIQSGNAAIGAGNAQAAGANATGTAISGLANNIGGYAQYRGLYGSGTPAVSNPYGGVANPTYYG